MAFVRILTALLRDKDIGPHVVPIVPDESRTFGMEGLFRQVGIFSQVGQLYRPQDADQLMYYREDPKGQILQEGINEPGAMASFIAAGTSYSTSNVPMIPFYIYYSMFGFQRVGDLAWAAGDMRTRGFLIGGTSGRTTLNGEGLQHEDGHSHVLASTIPNCVTYDPTYAYELAVIVHAGLKRMLVDQDDVYLLHHDPERELRPSGDAGRGGGGHPHAAPTSCATVKRRPARPAACVCSARARSCARSRRRPRCWPSEHGVSQRGLERHELHRTAPRRARRRALESCCIRKPTAKVPFITRALCRAARGRSSPRPIT